MILRSIFFLIATNPGAVTATPAPLEDGSSENLTSAETLRSARRSFEREKSSEARKEALRLMAQVALDDCSRSAAEARKALRKALSDRDLDVAAEAIRLAVLTDDLRYVERVLSSRLKETVRDLRRFMAEVERHRRVENPTFMRKFPELVEARTLEAVPTYVESLVTALAAIPGDRGIDALEDLLDLNPCANSGPLVLAAVDGLLLTDRPDALKAVVDWIRRHRKHLGKPAGEASFAKGSRHGSASSDRFGRLQGLDGFRVRYPPVSTSTYASVLHKVDTWAEQRQLPDPPPGDGDWWAWLREVR